MALRISVIVCAHNEARYLPGCLYSLLAQTRPPDCEKTWPAVKQALRSNVDVALSLFRNGPWAA